MKCTQCGSTTMKTKRENFPYDASGLRVTLVNVEVSRCPECGEYEVAIPSIDLLHRAIAMKVIEKKSRLAPSEITFLRKYLGWSKTELAKHMGIAPATVGRWEEGQAMGAIADRFLRLLVAKRAPECEYPEENLAEISDKKPAQMRLGMSFKKDEWHPQGDAAA